MSVTTVTAFVLAAAMAEDIPPVTYHCDDFGKSTIVATFMQTKPSTVRLVRGQTFVTATEGPTGSGARYVTPDGILFWEKGGKAQVEWPKGQAFNCDSRAPG